MTWFKKSAIFMFLTSYTALAFAVVDCPSTNAIRNLQFSTVDGSHDIWDLFSNPFEHANRNWQVVFTVYLPEASSTDQALQLGQDYYQYQVAFFEHPISSENNNRQVCYYAQQESSYFVRAISTN